VIELDPKTVVSTAMGAIGTAVIAWIGIIRRIDSKVSRHEFHENLERRDTRVRDDLKEVIERLGQQNDKLDKQNETSAEYRALSAEKLQKMSEDIAVLKDRAGRARGKQS